jgi:hypothetical protein
MPKGRAQEAVREGCLWHEAAGAHDRHRDGHEHHDYRDGDQCRKDRELLRNRHVTANRHAALSGNHLHRWSRYIGGAGADTATIQGEGVALITLNPDAVGAEGNGHGPNQTGAFYSIYSGGSVTGLLAAWAWGTSRIIDVIEQSDGSIIQAGAIGVTGCSRDGKAAFTAGAFDERIALTMPIESGTAGVPFGVGLRRRGARPRRDGQLVAMAYLDHPHVELEPGT